LQSWTESCNRISLKVLFDKERDRDFYLAELKFELTYYLH
jgi:hypothetical protein